MQAAAGSFFNHQSHNTYSYIQFRRQSSSSSSLPKCQYAGRRCSGGDLLEKPIALLPSTKLIKEGFEFKYKTLEHIYENMVEYGKALGILPN
ncbi:hypothetical protein BDA96_06G249700 [Sorghum bicolor]|uniref:Uncharacterized protein n=1 Tax=Sorghum bicolor TaxID=4558 RepID=A0A921QSF6_SORBI|nr:hypothetical protein BDA96_06G249700 [Sorghum bicolor]